VTDKKLGWESIMCVLLLFLRGMVINILIIRGGEEEEDLLRKKEISKILVSLTRQRWYLFRPKFKIQKPKTTKNDERDETMFFSGPPHKMKMKATQDGNAYS
jgi:hypothetical protein